MTKQTKSRATSAKLIKPRSRKLKAEPTLDSPTEAANPVVSVEMLRDALSTNHLDDQAITDLMLHCASVLAFRRAVTSTGTDATPGLCYRGVGGTDAVSLWLNGFKVETCSRQEAQDRGIPACG